jgi:hypothetical protein
MMIASGDPEARFAVPVDGSRPGAVTTGSFGIKIS